jgi:hypothetical protein
MTSATRFRSSAALAAALSAFYAGILAVAAPVLADDNEIAEIRAEIARLKADYEGRIAELEQRLEAAEQRASREAVARQAPTTMPGQVTAGNQFNPQVSVVLDGNFYHDDLGGAGSEVLAGAQQPSQPGDAGHGHQEDPSNGMNVRRVELAFITSVDPYFDASVFLGLESGGEVEIEEAWFASRGLPAGLRVKAGQLLSEVGYHNVKHEHEWDFADQNLAYLNLLGEHGLEDAGVQVTWLPELPLYTLFGVELLQGDQPRLGALVEDDVERAELGLSDPDSGPRMVTAFAQMSPDLGYDHALRLGGSYVRAQQHQEVDATAAVETGLEGDADLWLIDIVYKYDSPEAWGHKDFHFQAEYLRSEKDLVATSVDPVSRRKYTTDGLYAQGVYGFAPRWQLGVRYDVLGLVNEASGAVAASLGTSDRWTGALTWTPTEFSRFRLQYSRSDILSHDGDRERFATIWLQFIMTLGAHGAHRF